MKDKVDGREGVVIGRAEYLYTSPMVQVASEEKHNEAHWIDDGPGL